MKRIISAILVIMMCMCVFTACGKKKAVDSTDKIGGKIEDIGAEINKKAGVKTPITFTLDEKNDKEAFTETYGVELDTTIVTAAKGVPSDGSDKYLMLLVCTKDARDAGHVASRMYSIYMAKYEKNGVIAAAAHDDIALFVWLKPEMTEVKADDIVKAFEKMGDGELEFKLKSE